MAELPHIFSLEYWEYHAPLRRLVESEFEKLTALIQTQGKHIMALLDDIKAKQAQTLTELKADDDLISSLTAALQSKDATIATLNTELQAAIASNDPTALQAVSDAMDGLVSEANSQNAALVAAVQANTTPPAGSGDASTQQTGAASHTNASPVITSIVPDGGAAGDTVQVNGQNLNSSETVSFGTAVVPPTDINISADGTSAQVVVPAGTGQVQVMVSNGVGTSNSVPFAYGASQANQNGATPVDPNAGAAQPAAPVVDQSNPNNPNLSNTDPVGIGGTTANTTKDDGTQVQGTPA